MLITHPPVAEAKAKFILPFAFPYCNVFGKSILAGFGLGARPIVIGLLQDIFKLLRLPWRVCEGSSNKDRGLSPWTDVADPEVLSFRAAPHGLEYIEPSTLVRKKVNLTKIVRTLSGGWEAAKDGKSTKSGHAAGEPNAARVRFLG